jgi:hypothetical protein
VHGTIAGALVAPLGAAAFKIGPQWPLRAASVIFLAGTVVALRLPPRADSDPPETMPRIPRLLNRPGNGEKVLTERLVLRVIAGSAGLRALYGFLLLFLAFSVKAGDLDTGFLGVTLSPEVALGLVGGSLATGTFLATAAGTRLRIRRPLAVQAAVLLAVAALALLAALRFSLAAVTLLCLGTAIASGLAKLAVDASIQERVPERLRASAFAHAETLLMLAWVTGGAVGLLPLDGRAGAGLVAVATVLAAGRAALVAVASREERLRGKASDPVGPPPAAPGAPPAAAPTSATTVTMVGTPEPEHRDDSLAPPGYHIYRPSASRPADRTER